MTAVDPGLRFWLSYVEHSGGLVEPADGSALAVLPTSLQAQFGLPEEVSVTADPDVAREDGAILLSAGHPTLDAAADTVLHRGDTGRVGLAWPRDRLPEAADLLDKARAAIPVDHGRIDLRDEPSRAYLPVIRAGALVEYTVAGDDRFQERTECWVDATTRRELSGTLRNRLISAATTSIGLEPQLPADLSAAVDAAHRFVSRRADDRLKALDQQGRGASKSEIQRTEAYYAEVLASIARRRSNTAPDRLAMLDARVEATTAERSRRLDEIHEKFKARHKITPFRLHLLLVPTVVLPVDVLRGNRRYPQLLRWIWPAGAFAELPCPSCGSAQPLVAGKDRLGCEACLAKPPLTALARPGSSVPSASMPSASGPPGQRATAPVEPAQPIIPSAATTPAARRRSVAPPTPPPAPRIDPAGLRKLGEKLCFSFWQAVAAEDRKVKCMLLPDSPAEALHRLFGPRASAVAIGIPGRAKLTSVSGGVGDIRGVARIVSSGEVRTERHTYPFALVWRPVGGAAIIDEITSFAMSSPDLHPRYWDRSPGRPSLNPLPAPMLDLDPVAAQLWDVDRPNFGLPLVARCLAGWWRIGAPVGLGGHPSSTLAAAVVRLVSWRSGLRLTSGACAALHDVALAEVKLAERDLQRQLRLSADCVW